MTNIPLFGSAASLISPPAGTVTSGFLPLQYLPAEYLNYYLNADTQAVQELVNVIQFAGLTPGSSVQLLTALSGILTNAFAGTYVNKIAFTQPASLATFSLTAGKTLAAQNSTTLYGTDSNKIQTDAAIRGVSQGLLMTYVSTTSFSVAAGAAGDSTFVDMLYLASTLTKTTSSWAVGSGNGGLDTGAIAATTWYAVYLIKRPDTGVVDVLFSTNGTTPTLPSNYTLFRRIGWVRTNGSSQFIQWVQRGRQFFWFDKVTELNSINPASTNRILLTVTCPINTVGMFNIKPGSGSITGTVHYDSGWTAIDDVAASFTNCIWQCGSGYAPALNYSAPVDGSGQIYYRVDNTTNAQIFLQTLGWVDNLIN